MNSTYGGGIVDHRIRERDALRRGLGRVGDGRDPQHGLVEEGVAGKQRARVAVRAHAKQDQVESRKLSVGHHRHEKERKSKLTQMNKRHQKKDDAVEMNKRHKRMLERFKE